LEKNGFKSVYLSTVSGLAIEEWKPATGKISENCNKIITNANVGGNNLKLTLTRK
jgi:hypothetical protein